MCRSLATRSTAGRAPEEVDQYGRVQDDQHRGSASASGVTPALVADPSAWIVVSVVAFAGDTGSSGLQRCPATLLLQRGFDSTSYEGAPPARPSERINLADEAVVKLDVHSHVSSMAHSGYQPLARHSATCGRSTPRVESLPWPG